MAGVVVFIHGFMGSPRQFDRLAEAARRQGSLVAAPLLPGHGGSAKDFASGSFELWQGHVDSEVERFTQEYSDIWLVGHSMGGLLAINAAVRYGKFVRGIFTIACPFKLAMFSANAVKVRTMQVFCRESHPVKASYLSGSSVPLSPSLIWRTAKPAAELRRLMSAARANLPKVRAPVLAVYSASDEVTALGSLDIFKSGLTAAPFDHLLLSDSFHAHYPDHEQALIEQAFLGFAFAC